MRSALPALAAAVALAFPAQSAARPTDALREMLAMVPHAADYRVGPVLAGFADLAALRSDEAAPESRGAEEPAPEGADEPVPVLRPTLPEPPPEPPPEDASEVGTEEEEGTGEMAEEAVAAPAAFARLFVLPGPVAVALGAGEAVRPLLGFAAGDVERVLTLGQPPDEVLVLAGGPELGDPDAVGAALEARGFAARTLSGLPVWGRLEDHAAAPGGREPLDPFDAGRGRASRIAVGEGFVAGAASWPAVAAFLEGQAGPYSLADDPEVAALLDALDGVEPAGARLVQAVLLDGPTAAPAATALPEPATGSGPPGLPAYTMMLIADLQAGEEQVGVLGLVFGANMQAELAAEALPERWETVASAGPGEPLAAVLPDAAIEAAALTGDVPSVLFVMRRQEALEAGASPARLLYEALMRRDLVFAQPTVGPSP